MYPYDWQRLFAVGLAYILVAILLGELKSKKTVLTGFGLTCWGLPFLFACATGDGGPLGLVLLLVAVGLLAGGTTLAWCGIDRVRLPYRYW